METQEQKQFGIHAEGTDKQNSNSEHLVQREPIKGTPFVLTNIGDGWFVTLGKYRVTENYETMEGAGTKVDVKNWEFLNNVIGVVTRETIKEMGG